MNKNTVSKLFEVHVVLVKSIYPSNIGASARAMTNMGAKNLILISPQCEVDYSAQQAAASGQDPLQNRKVYATWDDFFNNEPEGIRLALTARDGRGRAVQDLATTLQWLEKEHPLFDTSEEEVTTPQEAPIPIYLFFGPEDWGLSREDLDLAHYCCSIPTFGNNTSLNLGQAVLLALFVLRSEWGGDRTQLEGQQVARNSESPAQALGVFPEETLKEWLITLGFSLDKKKTNVYTVLKRMILHNVPTPKEVNMLETVLQQTIRKLKNKN